MEKILNSKEDEINILDLIDKTSNECCILIDGCTAIYHLHPDEKMKEISFNSIISINNFFEELNSDKRFFNKLLNLYFSNFVTSGLLINTEFQSLLEKNLEELSNVNKEKNNQESQNKIHKNSISHLEILENLCNEMMSVNDFNYIFRVNEFEIDQLQTKPLKTLLKVYLDQHIKYQQEKKEENLVVLNDENSEVDENKYLNNNQEPKNIYHNLILNFDILNSIIRKSDSRVLRDRAFLTLYQQNSSHNYLKIKEILKARLAYSKSLGYSSYAEYQMHLNGIKIHPNKLIDYLINLWIDLRPNLILEYMQLYRGIKKDYAENNSNIKNNIMENKYLLNYEVDSLRALLIDLNLKYIDEKIISKKFITIGNILNGMQMLTKVLFNLNLEAVMDEDHVIEDLMHESILLTSLKVSNQKAKLEKESENLQYNSEVKVAKIYFDFFKRDGKFNDVFSQFTVRGSKNLNLLFPKSGNIRQTPIVVLATNFEVTELDLLNMPISFTDARNILHEFGHVLHSSLSKTDFQSVSGSRVPLDFAEIPSHFLEYFIYDYSFCKSFMIDNKTKMVIDQELHGLLSSQSQMFANFDLQETLLNSVFDLIVHSLTDEKHFENGNLEFLYNSLIKYFYVSSITSFNQKSFDEFEQKMLHYEKEANMKFPIDRFFNVLLKNSDSIYKDKGKKVQSKYLSILLSEEDINNGDKENRTNIEVLKKVNQIYKCNFDDESKQSEFHIKEGMNKMFIEFSHNINFNYNINSIIEQNYEEEKFKLNRIERERMYNKNLHFTTIPHFKNYPATYYSYVIGKIFANLIWTEGFYKADIDISKSGKILEEEYLSKGNTESSIKCIKNFLDRLTKDKSK